MLHDDILLHSRCKECGMRFHGEKRLATHMQSQHGKKATSYVVRSEGDEKDDNQREPRAVRGAPQAYLVIASPVISFQTQLVTPPKHKPHSIITWGQKYTPLKNSEWRDA